MMVMARRLLNSSYGTFCVRLLSGAIGRGYFSPSCGFPLLEGLPRGFFLGKCGLTSSEYRFKFAPRSAVCVDYVSLVCWCCHLLCCTIWCCCVILAACTVDAAQSMWSSAWYRGLGGSFYGKFLTILASRC